MRRSLIAVPVVLALGAGGYVMFHGGSHATPAPSQAKSSTTVTTRDGRIIDLSHVRSGVATPPTSSTPTPAIDPTTGAPPIAAPSSGSSAAGVAPTTATTATGSNASASAEASVAPAGDIGRFEDTHGSGATKPLPMPVRGSQGLQKRLGAMATCQGPEYATLTGQARSDYAKRCAKAGVTLPP